MDWASALVLLALCSMAGCTNGLDVAKSKQGWSPAGGQLLEDSLEALVVRDGAVAASFSVESSLLQQAMASFDLPSLLYNSPFSSLFPRLYVEHAQQSHFLVRHDAPVEVVNFGIIDGLDQISRSDPALKVSAVFKHYRATADETTGEANGESDAGQVHRDSPFLYHLELDYECAAEDPVRRTVVVQLRALTASTPSGAVPPPAEGAEPEPTLTFVFRKQCPLPPPPEPLVAQSIAGLFTSWGGPRGGSLLITTSSSSGEENLIRSRHPAMVMVSVDRLEMMSESQRAELMPQAPAYGHRRTPDQRESNEGSVLRRAFDMPAWLGDILAVVGMATIVTVALMTLADLLRGVIGSGEADEQDEMNLVEYEAVPLLTADHEDYIYDETISFVEVEKYCSAEELVKPNPETLTTSTTEAQDS